MAISTAGFRITESLSSFELSVDTDPSKASKYLDFAKVLANHNRPVDALSLMERVVKIFPNSSDIYGMKGSIETRLGFYKDAINSYSRAVELNGSRVNHRSSWSL